MTTEFSLPDDLAFSSPLIHELAAGQRHLLSPEQIRWCLRKVLLVGEGGLALERFYRDKFGISERPIYNPELPGGFWQARFMELPDGAGRGIHLYEWGTKRQFTGVQRYWPAHVLFEAWCSILLISELYGAENVCDMWNEGNHAKPWNLDIVAGETEKELDYASLYCLMLKDERPDVAYSTCLPTTLTNSSTWVEDTLAASYRMQRVRTLPGYEMEKIVSLADEECAENSFECIFSK